MYKIGTEFPQTIAPDYNVQNNQPLHSRASVKNKFFLLTYYLKKKKKKTETLGEYGNKQYLWATAENCNPPVKAKLSMVPSMISDRLEEAP